MHAEIMQETVDEGLPSSPSKQDSQEFPVQTSRPSSMVLKKAKTVIPPDLVAEAISTLNGLDLRWSGPITPSEMQYVEQYVFAKYPQYCNGLVEEEDRTRIKTIGPLHTLIASEPSGKTPLQDNMSKFPRSLSMSTSTSTSSPSDLDNTQLASPSRLLDLLSKKKSSSQAHFISIPEIQARNRALRQCGLPEEDYSVLFLPNNKDAMTMIGESYPFFRGNFYMTILNEGTDCIRDYAASKESKVIAAPESWLDLRIKGSQLSQYFRRKCKNSPKGLFSYPAIANGMRYSMHWISEAHRNSWHVLVDVTAFLFGEDCLALAIHRPDFVLCNLHNHNTQAQQSNMITCLLVRTRSFKTVL